MSETSGSSSELIELTSDIVAAFVANNAVTTSDLPDLIVRVHGALQGLGRSEQLTLDERPKPAVSIKKSVTNDFLVCLEDGQQFKSLKRHLRTKYGMTPEEYRAKWGLPKDYPMVAPSYAEERSNLAKMMGLGRKSRNAVKPAPSKGRQRSAT